MNSLPNTSEQLDSATGEKARAAHWEAVFASVDQIGLSPNVDERFSQVSKMTGQGIMDVAITLHKVLAPDVSHEPVERIMTVVSRRRDNRPHIDGSFRAYVFFGI